MASAAAAASVAAGSTGADPAACTVTWTGQARDGHWSTAANWSTGQVPHPADDVCITGASMVGPAGISVHSLRLGPGAVLDLSQQVSSLGVTSGLVNQGEILLRGTVSAASIENSGSMLAERDSEIDSPAFSNPGLVEEGSGTLRIPEAPAQLRDGRLSGGSWGVTGGTLVLPSDITQLSAGAVGLESSSLLDPSGHDALAGLRQIGPGATLGVAVGGLALTGELVSRGKLNVGDNDGGGQIQIAGGYIERPGASTSLDQGTVSAGSVALGAGSSLSGSGFVSGPLTNAGSVTPTDAITVEGNYVQTSRGALAESFGAVLHVVSRATLAGALDIGQSGGCRSGSGFDALTFGALRGSFTSHTPGFTLSTTQDAIRATCG